MDDDARTLPTGSVLSAATRLAGTPDVVMAGTLPRGTLVATARLLGTRIDTQPLAHDDGFAQAALVDGLTFVFRYGVIVTFGNDRQPGDVLAGSLTDHVVEPATSEETETARLIVRPGGEDRIDPDGQVVLTDDSADRLLLVATVLSRSVVLARDEARVSDAFERTAPVVAELRESGRVRLPIRQVMHDVGNVLAARHRVLGTVQVSERPDLLWDHPELDRLYARLEAEYELKDRAEMLEQKLNALGDFTEALLNIVQDKRAFRLEAAIIALIAFEVALNLFDRIVR